MKCLEKVINNQDPIKRITWNAIIKHTFWEEEFPQYQLPPQPNFDAYLTSRGINTQKFYEIQAQEFSPPELNNDLSLGSLFMQKKI